MAPNSSPPSQKQKFSPRRIYEVFDAFLRLGLTSFGGPIAHIGYFRREFVERRKWVNESQFAQLLAMCQFLPGPASSQMGFSLGLMRAGWLGSIAAFVAFTLPSAFLLLLFAQFAGFMTGPLGNASIHGLKLVALVVVAHGVAGMARNLCPDFRRAVIAVFATIMLMAWSGVWLQVLTIILGAIAGLFLLRNIYIPTETALKLPYGVRTGGVLVACFCVLLFGLPLLHFADVTILNVVEAFYRSGALVFGGGHVVLPLLEQALVAPGWLNIDDFMAGYGAAQAIPGPMFSLAAYLGAHLPGNAGGLIGAPVALVAIFLPGFLLVSGLLPLWSTIASHRSTAKIIGGVNAAVVGVLAAALYHPVWTSAIASPADIVIAIIGIALLGICRLHAMFIVLWCVSASVMLSSL